MSRSAFVMRDAKVANEEYDVHNLNNDYGGGDGGGGDMAERLERLEKKVDSIESTLSRLNESMARLDYKIDLQSAKLTSALDLQSNFNHKS